MSAFVILLPVVFVTGFVTVGFFTTDVGVVLVGVVVGFVVTTGFVETTGFVVVVGFVVTAGLVVIAGFVVSGFVVVAGLVVTAGLVVAGLVVDVSVGFVVAPVVNNGRLLDVRAPAPPETPEPPEDVIALEPPEPPDDVMDGARPLEIFGWSPTLRMMLSSGARSRPRASGSCLLDVRFFRIAMSYPVFFTNEVKPAMLLTGLRFAVLAKVLGGATVVGFLTGTAF